MRLTTVLKRNNVNENFNGLNFDEKTVSSDRSEINSTIKNILAEGGNDFFHYLTWLGLAKEPNLMVLSSMHHYYYDYNDLKGIRTLVNLKRLNQIAHLESFLHTLYRILPCQAHFIGCFKSSRHNDIKSSFYLSAKFLTGIINVFDSRTDRSLSKNIVKKLLEDHGFSVNDFTDINGITYFWAQNIRRLGD